VAFGRRGFRRVTRFAQRQTVRGTVWGGERRPGNDPVDRFSRERAEFSVWDGADYWGRVGCCWMNPVKHGFVERPEA